MGVRSSIFARATAQVTSIGTRCYPDRLPANPTLPCLRYQHISTPPNFYRDHDASPPDRWTFRYQIDGYASTSDAATTLGDQLFAAFEGWASGTAVGGVQVVNRFQEYDPAMERYRVMVELIIDHTI